MINITVTPTTKDPNRKIVHVHISNVIEPWSKTLTDFKFAILELRGPGHQIAEFQVSIARTLSMKQINQLALAMKDSKVVLKDSIMELPPDALLPKSAKAAQAKLDQVMADQQGSNKIFLPPHIRYCTPPMLHKALRKLQGTVHLHKDTHEEFGAAIAKALPNSMALILSDDDTSFNSLYSGNRIYAAKATLRELKPGNKLYVKKLSDVLCASIPVLKPQVALLLNIETMSQQDAITMIKLMPPGCILGLVVSQAQLNNEKKLETYRQCVLQLPKGCILKVTADMQLEFILSLQCFLPDGTALLVPKTFPSAPDHTWLTKIAHITTAVAFQLIFNEDDIVSMHRGISVYPTENSASPAKPGIYDIIQTCTLILPPGISRLAVDYLINHLPEKLSIELPKGLFLSAEQWDKLARPGIKVSGTLGFPVEMSKEEVEMIMQRLQPLLPEPRPILSTTVSDNQASLFIPRSPKRPAPEPGTMSPAESTAKKQHTNVTTQQRDHEPWLIESSSGHLPQSSSSSSSSSFSSSSNAQLYPMHTSFPPQVYAPTQLPQTLDPRFDKDSSFYEGEPADISQHALVDDHALTSDEDIGSFDERIIGGGSPQR